MPLTPTEAVKLSPKAVALAREIAAAVAEDGPDGKKITRAEARRILFLALEFFGQLVADLVD